MGRSASGRHSAVVLGCLWLAACRVAAPAPRSDATVPAVPDATADAPSDTTAHDVSAHDAPADAPPFAAEVATVDAAAGASDAALPCDASSCDDGQPCTIDQCDPLSGQCSHAPQAGPCPGGVCVDTTCCLPSCPTACSEDGCGGICPCGEGLVCQEGACLADPEWAQWPAPPDAPTAYAIEGETARDLVTGLMWQRTTAGPPMSQAAGKAACAASGLGGFSDWRLPTATELVSIIDWTRSSPAISPEAFPLTASAPFWSASRHAQQVDFGWAVDFDTGRLDFGPYVIEQALRVRCVRGPGGVP